MVIKGIKKNYLRIISIFLCIALFISGKPVFAQTSNPAIIKHVSTATLLSTSAHYSLPSLKGLRSNPDNPLKLEFIIDTANQGRVSKEEVSKLIKYFLAGLTLPEDDLWVNLSPYEQDHIIPESLGITDLGKEMLQEDYLLKQLAASLTYPETEIGKEYWRSIGSNQSFNKVWIMPGKASVYENNNTAFITESALKVMMEEDYLAMNNNKSTLTKDNTASLAMKEKILPVIAQEINYGKNFASLRQIYNSLILAVWFKQKFKQSFYKHYIDQRKIEGIGLADKNIKDKIWRQYVQAFKQGAYDYVKTEKILPRKTAKHRYFSGGEVLKISPALTVQGPVSGENPSVQSSGPLAKASIIMRKNNSTSDHSISAIERISNKIEVSDFHVTGADDAQVTVTDKQTKASRPLVLKKSDYTVNYGILRKGKVRNAGIDWDDLVAKLTDPKRGWAELHGNGMAIRFKVHFTEVEKILPELFGDASSTVLRLWQEVYRGFLAPANIDLSNKGWYFIRGLLKQPPPLYDYTYAGDLKGLLGFADNYAIAISSMLVGDNRNLTYFHEAMHYFINSGRLRLDAEVQNSQTYLVVYDGQGVRVGEIKLTDADAIFFATRHPRLRDPESRNHYLIRALQRQIFTTADILLSEKIDLLVDIKNTTIQKIKSDPLFIGICSEDFTEEPAGKMLVDTEHAMIKFDEAEPGVYYKISASAEDFAAIFGSGRTLNQKVIDEARGCIEFAKAGITGIPEVLGIGICHDDRVWVKMRSIVGKDLDSKEFKSFDILKQLRILIKAVGIVKNIHDHGLGHGDLTSKNIIANEDEEVMLIDLSRGRKSDTIISNGVNVIAWDETTIGDVIKDILTPRISAEDLAQSGLDQIVVDLKVKKLTEAGKMIHPEDLRISSTEIYEGLSRVLKYCEAKLQPRAPSPDAILKKIKANPVFNGKYSEELSDPPMEGESITTARAVIVLSKAEPGVYYKIAVSTGGFAVGRSFNDKVVGEAEQCLQFRQAGITGVPELLGIGVCSDGRVWVKMRSIVGKDLNSKEFAVFDILKQLKIFTKAVGIIKDISDHGLGHGDFERKNIIANEREEVELIDFATAGKGDKERYGGSIASWDQIKAISLASDIFETKLTGEDLVESGLYRVFAGNIVKKDRFEQSLGLDRVVAQEIMEKLTMIGWLEPVGLHAVRLTLNAAAMDRPTLETFGDNASVVWNTFCTLEDSPLMPSLAQTHEMLLQAIKYFEGKNQPGSTGDGDNTEGGINFKNRSFNLKTVGNHQATNDNDKPLDNYDYLTFDVTAIDNITATEFSRMWFSRDTASHISG